MKLFVCVIDPNGSGFPPMLRRTYESFLRSRGLGFRWQSLRQTAVLTGGDEPEREPMVATHGDGSWQAASGWTTVASSSGGRGAAAVD